MSENPITQGALDQLAEREYVTEFQEGTQRAKMLTPAELLQLHELENRLAADDARATKGIYRILD